MTTETKPDQLPDDLLDDEIPCGGIIHHPIARSCSAAATVRTFGHGGCPYISPASFKCHQCWSIWYNWHKGYLVNYGLIRCSYCGRTFTTVEAFADYRPLR